MQSLFITENQSGQRFDKYLHKQFPNAGTSFLYKMLRKKNITLNKKKATGNEILALGDEINCFFSEETFQKFTGGQEYQDVISNNVLDSATRNTAKAQPGTAALEKEYIHAYKQLSGIKIVYEDKHLLLANKPANVLCQKAGPGDISLNEWFIGYLLYSKQLNTEELRTFKPSICNRIDRNTTGLVICGKTLKGLQTFNQLIKERKIGKFYRTIAVGRLDAPISLKGYLEKNEKTNQVKIHKEADYKGKGEPIETNIYPVWSRNDLSYLEVELITGKPHQIRAHLSSIGHPIVGDKKYGYHGSVTGGQLLHAYRLEFPTDFTGEMSLYNGKIFTAPLPEKLQHLVGKEG